MHGVSLWPTHDLKKVLPVEKCNRRHSSLADYDAMALQQACINLDKAFRAFFDGRARFPRFKRKNGWQSSYHCSGKIAVGDTWITVPKCHGCLPAVIHCEITGRLCSITLSRTPTGTYFAPLLGDDGVDAPAAPDTVHEHAVVGIDASLEHVTIESNGRKTDNPKIVKRAQFSLRRSQKVLSRKKRGQEPGERPPRFGEGARARRQY